MLSQAEDAVRTTIKSSDTPFLGLLGEAFTPDIRQQMEMVRRANPTVQGYASFLSRFPAIFAVHLTAHIMEGMGQRGHFELYPHAMRAIGTKVPLTQTDRDKLWRAFRRAILTLGFIPATRISGTHFMAAEYLRQVGVPLAFADDLAQKMLAFAKRIGLPDEDDPEAIRNWQRALDARLLPPFSVTARNAVLLDTEAYYTRVFLQVHKGLQSNPGYGNTELEKAMARAFNAEPEHISFRRAILPFVVLNDGILGVFIPGGDEQEFEFQIDGAVQCYRSATESRFVPLSNLLTREVVIRDSSGRQASSCRLWEDQKTNRVLIFTETGRLRAAGQLNQEEPLLLPPGNYFCLSRFEPSNLESDPISDFPELYGARIAIHPGKDTCLSNGPARLVIQGDLQPFAGWSGKSRTSRDGIEFQFDVLRLSVEFPPEWAACSGRAYVFRLSATALGNALQIPFTIDEAGRAEIRVSDALKQEGWSPGFARITADISRLGETRSLLHCSTLYWFGLADIKQGMRFVCEAMPTNIQRQLSENIEIDGNIIKPKDKLLRSTRLVFKLDERRHQTLAWNVPGIFIEVESTPATGGTIRVNKSLGSVEVVSVTSNKQILISSSDSGVLSLGDWSQHVDFSTRPTKRLPASFLSSRLASGKNVLTFRHDASVVDLELLRLVQPHFVKAMHAHVSQRQYVVRFNGPRELEALRISGLDILSGKSFSIETEANRGVRASCPLCRVQFMCLASDEGGYAAYAYLDLENSQARAWVFEFNARIGGVWGHLENERQDSITAGLICDSDGKEVRIGKLLSSLDALSDEDSLAVLTRAQDAMLPCYADESWIAVRWLLDIWQHLLSRWKGRASEAVTTFVALVGARPAEDASPSWLLQQTIGAEMPEIFALPAPQYRQVNVQPYPLATALRTIADLKSGYPNVFPDLIHFAAASGFSNLAAIAQGAVPHAFCLDKYIETLQQCSDPVEESFKLSEDSFQPGPGDWLGPIHLKFAVRSLETAYDRSLGGNEIRRGQAIGLCRQIKQRMPFLNIGSHVRLQGKSPEINPWPYPSDDAVSDEVAQRRENFSQMAHCISLLAYHCRLGARSPDKLSLFLQKLKATDLPTEGCLAYLLQIGEALFAYYLLLWDFILRAERIK